MPNEDEILAHPEQPTFLFSSWLWAVVLFVFFGAIVAIAFGAMHRGSTYEEDRAKNRAEKLKTAREEWSKSLTSYGWVDKGKGIARIPIERAMELTLADLQAKKPTAAGPIATPVSSPAPGASQPANPPTALPGTQPGASATPAAAPQSHSEMPPVSPTPTPALSPAGTPLPVPGKP